MPTSTFAEMSVGASCSLRWDSRSLIDSSIDSILCIHAANDASIGTDRVVILLGDLARLKQLLVLG